MTEVNTITVQGFLDDVAESLMIEGECMYHVASCNAFLPKLAQEYLALQEQVQKLAANEGYKQAFYEIADILAIGARADSPKNVFESVIKPMLINLKKESAEQAELGSAFDDLAHAIGWSRERCEQTGESPKDVAVSLVNLVSELEKDAFPTTDEWAIDKTCGRPILVYKGCSVIEAEDAAYILKLVKEDKIRAGEQP